MQNVRLENLARFSEISKANKINESFLVYYFLIRDLKLAISSYAKGMLLDIGCGNKPYEELFNGKISEYVGCDISQSSLLKVDIICDSTQIPFEDKLFDTIFSTQTIEHVFDHQKMLSESFRLLKPDGHLIVSGPMYWPLHEEPYDFFRFTKYGFEALLKKTGFEVVEILPNGGKWAVLGTTIMQTLPSKIKFKIVKWTINSIFLFLDKRYLDTTNTLNYVVIAKKVF